MLQTLITGTVGPLPIYQTDWHWCSLRWNGCGLESVPRCVVTLVPGGGLSSVVWNRYDWGETVRCWRVVWISCVCACVLKWCEGGERELCAARHNDSSRWIHVSIAASLGLLPVSMSTYRKTQAVCYSTRWVYCHSFSMITACRSGCCIVFGVSVCPAFVCLSIWMSVRGCRLCDPALSWF